MGGMRVQEFLTANICGSDELNKAIKALSVVKNSDSFSSHAERITSQCNVPSMGWSLAQRSNTAWLNDAFSSRKMAKARFGQPLSPVDTNAVSARERKDLVSKLHPYFANSSEEDVTFILGGEGHGKSWIVAQSWLALDPKPLLLFMSPEDFSESAGQNDIKVLLLSTLIRQTGEDLTDAIKERWSRRLFQWRRQPTAENSRIIVVIDGINQRPDTDWARIIEKFSYELCQLSGRLIVTSRTPYFRERVKGRLYTKHSEIIIPEWTETERDEILTENGINASALHRSVAVSLKNPRLLGIAIELLNKADVSNFEELSVSRLLFEHIRMSERDAPLPQPARKFAHRLQQHAQEIIGRSEANQQDDLHIFENDIGAVADGRFYQEVDGDPTRYSLIEDGLTLALGFAVIDRLLTALRNNRSLDAELDVILEPIEALDDTADVVLAAMTVTDIDKHYNQRITASLVKSFASLQNPSQAKFPAFVGLTKTRPQGFLIAARELCLEATHQANFDWIESALVEVSRNEEIWRKMADNIHLWLSLYSSSPDLGARYRHGNNSVEKIAEEREKNSKKIEGNLQSLTTNERVILYGLQEVNCSFDRLSRLALSLLAGKPLAPFAQGIVNWSFSCALNSDYPPRKEFLQLVRFNRIDWHETREALLETSNALGGEDISKVGKWALVTTLRATGQIKDAEKAKVLVDELTKDWPHHKGWRRVEDYCATDPCEPLSEYPENINNTVKNYSVVDVSKLYLDMWQSSDDHFFTKASLGLARFSPKEVVCKIEELIVDVLTRTDGQLQSGLIGMFPYLALLKHEDANQLIEKWHKLKKASKEFDLSESNAWQVSQSLLLLSFPFLSAREQADILISDESDDEIYVDFEEIVKPISEKEFENFLDLVCLEENERRQYLLLRFAACALPPISEKASGYIDNLFHSKSKRVRMFALKIIALSNNERLQKTVANSEWRANDSETENGFESWYGSIALLDAAKKNLLSHENALERISARCYGYAATVLDNASVCEIARRVNVSIGHVAKIDLDQVAPDIEIEMVSPPHGEPCHFVLRDRPLGFEGSLRQRAEDRDVVDERLRSAFTKFSSKLSLSKANIILDSFRLKEFETIVSVSKEHADYWYELFLDLPKERLPSVHNFVILLAYALVGDSPEKAENLFSLISSSEPYCRLTYGAAGINFDSIVVWTGERTIKLDELRCWRLDRVTNDHDLSLEVLAASKNNQHELLKSYVNEKIAKKEPAEIARGIMVAGFSDQSKFNDRVLNEYENCAGFIGNAHKAAKYAYERNVWARHWFQKMCQTEDNINFWRFSVLFLKIVDGRFTAWRPEFSQKGEPIKQFGVSCDGALKRRLERWKHLRKNKLFGDDAPAKMFL